MMKKTLRFTGSFRPSQIVNCFARSFAFWRSSSMDRASSRTLPFSRRRKIDNQQGRFCDKSRRKANSIAPSGNGFFVRNSRKRFLFDFTRVKPSKSWLSILLARRRSRRQSGARSAREPALQKGFRPRRRKNLLQQSSCRFAKLFSIRSKRCAVHSYHTIAPMSRRGEWSRRKPSG